MEYRNDISYIPFSVTEIFDDPDDVLWAQETLIKEVLDDHAPLKTKRVQGKELSFIHKQLKKSIFNKTDYKLGLKTIETKEILNSLQQRNDKIILIFLQSRFMTPQLWCYSLQAMPPSCQNFTRNH